MRVHARGRPSLAEQSALLDKFTVHFDGPAFAEEDHDLVTVLRPDGHFVRLQVILDKLFDPPHYTDVCHVFLCFPVSSVAKRYRTDYRTCAAA